MAKNAHLTLSDRIAIEVGLRERRSFASIAQELGKDPSTISKEVRNHVKLSQILWSHCQSRSTENKKSEVGRFSFEPADPAFDFISKVFRYE